jgi:hypothetical protein
MRSRGIRKLGRYKILSHSARERFLQRSVTRNKYEVRLNYRVDLLGGRKISISAATFLALAVLLSVASYPDKTAYADGIFREEFNASLEGREARLSVEVNPPVLTSETRQDAFVQFRLFDGNTNETIDFSTFVITIEKGVGEDAERLMRNVFHTESGLLTLRMQPREGEVTILGTQEQFINAWVADPGGNIGVRGPIFLEGGLYHFGIEILGVDSIRELFPPDRVPTFDSYLSVGDVFSETVNYNENAYNTTIISYYDRIEEFDFDSSNRTFTWAMPFDWNSTRIDQATIFVHEEVQIPKAMESIGDSVSFKASVNDVPISGSKIVVDPYTSDTNLVLHYLLNKPDILALAEEVPDGVEQMTFALTPSSEVEEATTTEMSTDTGGINVALQWNPDPLNADTESTVDIVFSDAFSGQELADVDVLYDLRILDMNGTVVFDEQDLVAAGGTASQTIDFPRDDNYRIEVQVTGLQEGGRPVDMTRNGIARGLVVVPEFPMTAILVIGSVIASMVLWQRFGKGWSLPKA